MKKYHIEKNTVQETLLIPLYGRKVCAEVYPDMISDREAVRIIENIDYDFSEKSKLMHTGAGLFGALEAAQRNYDLLCEIKAYLKEHPYATVVNMGCGLDTTFTVADNGTCTGYNLDFADVIEMRNGMLPPGDREHNIACDLNDFSWFEQIDFRPQNGIIFIAAGVFYYFEREKIQALMQAMAAYFKGGRLCFDSCNKTGAKMMMKTWIKQAGIANVNAYFHLEDAERELAPWSAQFAAIGVRDYMNGYRPIDKRFGAFNRTLAKIADSKIKMKIVGIDFKQ